MKLGKIIAVAFAICISQVTWTWLFADSSAVPLDHFYKMQTAPGWNTTPKSSQLTNGYARFNNWDSLRFFEIAENGYHAPADRAPRWEDIPDYANNFTTPPAYPLFTRVIHHVLGIDTDVSLLIAAELSCVVLWIYLILLLQSSGLREREIQWAAFLIAIYPSAFYLVCGYSESLFIASTLGLFYWTNRWLKESKVQFWWIALLHGMIATATRTAGLPVIVYPLIAALAVNPKVWKQGALLSAATALGFGSFLIFSAYRFGRWDLYFQIAHISGEKPDPFAIFKVFNFIPRFFFETTVVSINRGLTLLMVVAGGVAFYQDRGRKKRAALYSVIAGFLFTTVSSRTDAQFDSMIRYTLPIQFVLVLAIAEAYKERDIQFKKRPRLFTTLILLSIALQGWSAWRFLHGKWVS